MILFTYVHRDVFLLAEKYSSLTNYNISLMFIKTNNLRFLVKKNI